MARILIVDDDADLVDDCRRVLEGAGHLVRAAHSASAGKAAVGVEAPDLMVLDVMMERPDDGILLARELRAAGSAFPIVMLTSLGTVTGLSYGRSDDLLPVDAFLDKPVQPAELLRTVAKHLAGR